MSGKFEYFVRQTGEVKYEVSKFDSMSGGEQPLVVYNVIWDPARGRGKCDCPAGTYRQTGAADKHVKIVQEWIAGGRQIMAILK